MTILAFDTEPARRCGQLKNTLRRARTSIAEPDLQIASIVLHYGLALATHNQRHFARVPGVQLLDWLIP
jgi:tRNA(fMet)-specific endonuclease VapC